MDKPLKVFVGIFLTGLLVVVGFFVYFFFELSVAYSSEHDLNEKNIVILRSETSPNKIYIFYEYQFDQGGMGYSRVFWSAIKNDSEISSLEDGLLPDGYRIIGWSDNSELLIEEWELYYYKNTSNELRDKEIFKGIPIILSATKNHQ